MFHVYVDPLHGDDAAAFMLNPGAGTSLIPPLHFHPDDGSPTRPRPIGGMLTSAPYPFRTVNGPQGAIAYINVLKATFGTDNPPIGRMRLPLKILNVGRPQGPKEDKWVEEIVIHCLPGLYGSFVQGLPNIDPTSGIPFNGEVFPIPLDSGISIQGTSALDTIFDCRRQAQKAGGGFLIGADLAFPFTVSPFERSFIDSITVRGARSDGEPPGRGPSYNEPFNRSGAGIWIGISPSIEATVSNCILTDNTVGIAIDGIDPTEGNILRPRIINNTIAWNWIGIWNGSLFGLFLPPDQIGFNVGYGHPIVLNNVIDSGSPYVPGNGFAAPRPFVGIHPNDLLVTTRTTASGSQAVNINFNAYEPTLANTIASNPSNWPTPGVRNPPVPPLPPPIVDISSYTLVAPYPPGGTRGALYVNDLFRKSQILGAGTDPTPHDFRLAPNVAPAGTSAPAPFPASANPLVNKGLAIDGVTLSITFANGTTLSRPPGIPSPGPDPDYLEDYASCHSWDWDCEGHGNPRIQLRPGYTEPPAWSAIDLGADEMGELLICGFIDGTRMLASLYPPTLPNKRIWFAERNSGGPFARPNFNVAIGRTWLWYSHKQLAPDAATGSNLTLGVGTPQTIRNVFTTAGLKPMFPRALECDITGHLFMDPHAQWGALFDARVPPAGDIYAMNPWADNYVIGPLLGDFDNPMIFYNPDPGYPKHGDGGNPPSAYWFMLPQLSANLLGVANPPNTWFDGTTNYLLPNVPTAQFGPFGTCTGSTYTVNAWGLGSTNTGCPDDIPLVSGLEGHGIRYNCQLPSAASNLQTLLAIADGMPGESAAQMAARSIPASALPRRPTDKEIGAALTSAYRTLHLERSRK